MRKLSITSQQLEAIIVSAHDLRPASRSAIASRLRYLQRLQFPRAAETGRGKRLEYGLEDALKILVVFRYLEWSLSPVRAVRTVVMNWPTIARTLVTAWRADAMRAAGDAKGAGDLRALMVVAPTALADVNDDPSRLDEQSPETVGLMRPAELGEWAAVEEDDGDVPQLLVIDPVRLVRRLVAAIMDVASAYDFEVDAAFRELAASAFGTEEEMDWRLTP